MRPSPRPSGPLIWLHLPLYEGSGPIRTLLARAREEMGPLNALVTFDKPAPGAADDDDEAPDFVLLPGPAESQSDTAAFLAHWRPDLLIWVGGPFRPVLLAEVDAVGLPRVLINAKADALGSITGTWVPGMSRALIGPFRHVLTTDEDAALRLERMGIERGVLEITGVLDDDPDPPPCDEMERAQIAAMILPRPVWLGAAVPLQEIATLLGAFRVAQRRAHRLLLVLDPATPRDGGAIRDRLAAEGLRVALRSEGQVPDEHTEIIVADRRHELGLWLRMAPTTYLGGSLAGSGCLHPYIPAALGSAIVHGPSLGRYETAGARLGHAGATRHIDGSRTLGQTIAQVLAPDRAAAMAHAGYMVVAANAAVTNRLTEIIANVLDEVPA